MMEKTYYRVAEITSLLVVSRRRIYQRLAERKLPHVRYGRAIRVPRAALEQWLAAECRQALRVTDGSAIERQP